MRFLDFATATGDQRMQTHACVMRFLLTRSIARSCGSTLCGTSYICSSMNQANARRFGAGLLLDLSPFLCSALLVNRFPTMIQAAGSGRDRWSPTGRSHRSPQLAPVTVQISQASQHIHALERTPIATSQLIKRFGPQSLGP
jgi:hypothetical protein